jgi:hypothetical protein
MCIDKWMDVPYSVRSLSLDDESSYSQVIMMMMVVTGTEMPHIETKNLVSTIIFF